MWMTDEEEVMKRSLCVGIWILDPVVASRWFNSSLLFESLKNPTKLAGTLSFSVTCCLIPVHVSYHSFHTVLKVVIEDHIQVHAVCQLGLDEGDKLICLILKC